jgi:hypothetical protein
MALLFGISVNTASKYVRMNFDVDVDELVENPTLIHSAIIPKSRAYRTYPHAERDLNRLRETLARFRN